MDEREKILELAGTFPPDARKTVHVMLGSSEGIGAALHATVYLMIRSAPKGFRQRAIDIWLEKALAVAGDTAERFDHPSEHVLVGIAAAQKGLKDTHRAVVNRLRREGELP